MPRSFDGVFYGAAGTPTGEFDNQFNRVSFLSHFEGANNGVNNAFDDGSASNRTITDAGNTNQGSFGPFARPDGEWGVSFDGASDYLDANDGTTFGNGAFTIEFFVNLRVLGTNCTLFDARPNSTNGSYPTIYKGTNNNLAYYSSTTDRITSNNNVMFANTWHHVALCRSGTSTKLFLDGTQVGSTFSDSTNYVDGGRMRVGTSGYRAADGFHVDGVISNWRVVNSALYTSNFTAPAGKLTAITNTKLLTCQSNRFVDNSASPLTMTASNDAAVTAFGPFLTREVYDPAVNGASSIGGTSGDNYVYAGTSSDFHFGSGNFTIELWTYPLGSGKNLMACGGGSIVSSSINFNYGGNFDFYYQSTQLNLASPPLTKNSWQYITVVRNGGTITVYKDGVATGTVTIGSNSLNTGGSSPFYIGGYPQAQSGNINGYLSDVRVVKGTAVYTSNFTPPTAPLTAITNTKLLLNMKDGQAIDSAAQNNMTLVANSKISTAQKKIGTSSLYVDGSGDYVTFPYTPFGTGDFTVECWVRCLGSSYDKSVWDNHTASGSSDGLTLTRISEQKFRLFGTGELISSGNFTITNTWVNVTVVRSSGTLNLFVNGVSQGTAGFTTNLDSTSDFLIGGGRYAGGPETGSINAYIDEFRISHFARYSSNFTPDTEPFADKGK